MSKKVLLSVSLTALCLSFIGNSSFAATTNGNASVTIGRTVSVQETSPIAFGFVNPNGAAGTVSMSQAGVITCTGSGFICPATGQNGAFAITGDNTSTVNISYVNGTMKNGTQSIVVTPSGPSTLTLSGGNGIIATGGSFTLIANQSEGLYTTSANGGAPYQVVVNY